MTVYVLEDSNKRCTVAESALVQECKVIMVTNIQSMIIQINNLEAVLKILSSIVSNIGPLTI